MNIKRIFKIIFVSIVFGGLFETGTFIRNSSNQSYLKKSEQSQKTIEVMFTPGEECTQRIVNNIKQAKKEILVQAYSFTSAPIIEALIQQHKKGIKIIILLDKSQENSIYVAKVLNAGIEVYIDKMSGIAHNKVIILDQSKVFTGSFNFSQGAQTRNAENSLLITDKEIVIKFYKNFFNRLQCKTTTKKTNEQPKFISKL